MHPLFAVFLVIFLAALVLLLPGVGRQAQKDVDPRRSPRVVKRAVDPNEPDAGRHTIDVRGAHVSGVTSDGNHVIAEKVTLHGSKCLLNGIRIVDDEEGTRVVVPPGLTFSGVVNGHKVHVGEICRDQERTLWLEERAPTYRT